MADPFNLECRVGRGVDYSGDRSPASLERDRRYAIRGHKPPTAAFARDAGIGGGLPAMPAITKELQSFGAVDLGLTLEDVVPDDQTSIPFRATPSARCNTQQEQQAAELGSHHSPWFRPLIWVTVPIGHGRDHEGHSLWASQPPRASWSAPRSRTLAILTANHRGQAPPRSRARWPTHIGSVVPRGSRHSKRKVRCIRRRDWSADIVLVVPRPGPEAAVSPTTRLPRQRWSSRRPTPSRGARPLLLEGTSLVRRRCPRSSVRPRNDVCNTLRRDTVLSRCRGRSTLPDSRRDRAGTQCLEQVRTPPGRERMVAAASCCSRARLMSRSARARCRARASDSRGAGDRGQRGRRAGGGARGATLGWSGPVAVQYASSSSP